MSEGPTLTSLLHCSYNFLIGRYQEDAQPLLIDLILFDLEKDTGLERDELPSAEKVYQQSTRRVRLNYTIFSSWITL